MSSQTIRLRGPGLNNIFAVSIVDMDGPTAARRKTCGPMLEAVREVIAARRAPLLERAAAVFTTQEMELLIGNVEAERNDLAWALCEVLDGTKPHDLPAETGLDEMECARLYAIWQEARIDWLKLIHGPDVSKLVPKAKRS